MIERHGEENIDKGESIYSITPEDMEYDVTKEFPFHLPFTKFPYRVIERYKKIIEYHLDQDNRSQIQSVR